MLTHVFLESLWKLGLLLVVVQVALIAIWSYRRTPRSAKAVWLGFGTIPVLLFLSMAIKTSREQIQGVCESMAIAVEQEDVGGVVYYLAPTFRAESIDYNDFKDLIVRAFKRYTVYNPRLSGFEFEELSDDSATVVFQASCRVESRDFGFNWLPTKWRLSLIRVGDAWRVDSMQSIPVPPLRIRNLDQTIR